MKQAYFAKKKTIFACSSFDDTTLKIFNVETLENLARGLGKCP